MRSALVFIFLCCFGTSLMAQSTKWTQDASHSDVSFNVKHLVISSATGNFKDYSVTVLSDKEDFSDAKIDVTINTGSIDTDNENRDKHLRSDDFFNSEKYPAMTFKGRSLKKVGKNTYKLTGDLTIRNITKTVTLDVEFGGRIKDPWGNTKAGFRIEGVINRFDYGLKWDKALETGGLVVDKDVRIICNIELTKQA